MTRVRSAVLLARIGLAVAAVSARAHGAPRKTGSVYEQVAAELMGIPQSGTTLGSPGARVTIQFFDDLECPVCKALTLGQIPTLNVSVWLRDRQSSSLTARVS